MQQNEFRWNSADGISFYGKEWRPENTTAVICLVHGLGEHCNRYNHVAERFGQAGYAMLSFDLRGHGRSGGQRGHIPSLEAAMEDIHFLWEEAGRRFAGKSRFLYGHSLGGLLAFNYLITRQPAAAGAVITAPGLKTALHEKKFKVWLVNTLGGILPTAAIKTELDANTLARDQAVVQAYRADPLVHDDTSLGMGKCLLNAIKQIDGRASEIRLPILLAHGANDRLAYPEGSEMAAKKLPNCTLKLWPGLFHEIHNEPEQAEVLGYTQQWMDQHLPA